MTDMARVCQFDKHAILAHHPRLDVKYWRTYVMDSLISFINGLLRVCLDYILIWQFVARMCLSGQFDIKQRTDSRVVYHLWSTLLVIYARIVCHRCGKCRNKDGGSVCRDINSIKTNKAYFLNMIVIAWRVRIAFKRNMFAWLINVYLMSSLLLMSLATDERSCVQYFESGRQ